MADMTGILSETRSICPVCHTPADAAYTRERRAQYLTKRCPDHGTFRAKVWKGRESAFYAFQEGLTAPLVKGDLCDLKCAGCTKHLTPPCCVVLEVTERCNMYCPFCLASGGGEGRCEPSYEELTAAVDDLYAQGVRSVHFGGGEPTVREDLAEITAFTREKGFEYIQLNTNGIRLAKEAGYAKKLAGSGIDCAFMQFDSTRDEEYIKIRGRALIAEKEAAIDACYEAGIGVILVPAIVPGINDGVIGDIVRFAVSRMPAVRGIHFQPVTYMGRVPKEAELSGDAEAAWPHFTIPEVLEALEEQTGGMIKSADIHPAVADHPLCGFHGEFRMTDEGLKAMARNPDRERSCCCSAAESVRREQLHVQNRWTLRGDTGAEPGTLDAVLEELSAKSFTISGMPFMDAMTLDIRRMMQCTLRVYRKGTLLPFCLEHTLNG